MFFNGRASVDEATLDKEWRSYIHQQGPARCLSDKSETPLPLVNYSRPKEYAIEIIRHEPLVAVVCNFATDQECGERVRHRRTAGRIRPVSTWITRTEPT